MATCSSPESAGSCPPLLKGGCPSICVSVRRLLLLEVGNTSPGLDLGLAKCFGGVFPVAWRSSWVFLLWHSKFPPVKVALTIKIKRFLFFFPQLPSASSAEPGWGSANSRHPPSLLPATSPSQRICCIMSPTSPRQRFKPFSPSGNPSPGAHPRADRSPGALSEYQG